MLRCDNLPCVSLCVSFPSLAWFSREGSWFLPSLKGHQMAKTLYSPHGACLGLSRWVPKEPSSPGFDGGYLILGACTVSTAELRHHTSLSTTCPCSGQRLANTHPEVHGALRSQPRYRPPTITFLASPWERGRPAAIYS